MIIFDNGKFELKGTPLKNGVLSIELASGKFIPSEWTGEGNDWTVRFENGFLLNLHTDGEIMIDPAKYGAFGNLSFFWNEHPVRQLGNGSFELELDPHDSAGIRFC